MDQFFCFGDSITEQAFSSYKGPGFGVLLANAYTRKLDVVNRGFSGYNSQQGLQILPKFMPRPECVSVRFMTVAFGSNDARLPNTPRHPQQHIPLDEFKTNLKAIVTHPLVLAHKDIRVILATTMPMDEHQVLHHDRTEFPDTDAKSLQRNAATNAKYAQAVREVGQELGIPVLDLWSAMMSHALKAETDKRAMPGELGTPPNPILREYLSDGLHISASGYKVIYDEILALIGRTWPDQMPHRLPLGAPAWDDEGAWRAVGTSR